mgnify:CR=1 FL=1
MAAPTITYSPAAVVLTIAGVRIQGFAPDSQITVSPSSDIATTAVGADGTVAVSASSDARMTLAVSLMQGSTGNQKMSELAQKQRNQGAKDAFSKVAVTVYDSITKSTVSGDAYFTKFAPQAYGKEAGTRAWELVLPQGLQNYAEKAA